MTTEVARKKPHPARSARILVTGLSATALFGMLGGYAYAERQIVDVPDTEPVPAPSDTPPTPTVDDQQPAPSMPLPAATPANVLPPKRQAKRTTTRIVEVPTPAPAQPGGGGNAGSSQRSSGSN